MKSLHVFDLKPMGAGSNSGSMFLELRDIMRVVAPLARDTHWQIGDFVEEDGTDWFEFADADWSQRKFAQEGLRIPTADLVTMAQSMPQAIWASFSGFRPIDAPSAWIVLNAVDSSFWRMDTDDLTLRRVLRASFADVRTQER